MTKRTATTAAIILSVAAAGAPAAGARPAQFLPASQQSPASVYSRPDKSMIPVSPPAAYSGASGQAAALQAPAPAHVAQSGFDWGDAGIGAAGGIGIVMLAVGGGLVAVRMRRDHFDPATR